MVSRDRKWAFSRRHVTSHFCVWMDTEISLVIASSLGWQLPKSHHLAEYILRSWQSLRNSPPCKVRYLFHQKLKIVQLKPPSPPQLHPIFNIIRSRLSLHLAFQCCLHLWSPHACYMFRSNHRPSLCNGINNWWTAQIGRPYIRPFFATAFHFISLRSKYSLHPTPKHNQS